MDCLQRGKTYIFELLHFDCIKKDPMEIESQLSYLRGEEREGEEREGRGEEREGEGRGGEREGRGGEGREGRRGKGGGTRNKCWLVARLPGWGRGCRPLACLDLHIQSMSSTNDGDDAH